MRVSRSLLLLPLLTGLALWGCTENTAVNLDDKSRVSIKMKDAPGDFQAAVVTIAGIYLQGSPGDSTSQDGGRVWLSEEEVTTDLLTLANDVVTLVDEVDVPRGHYAQLRFVITGGYIEVEGENGETSIYASSPDYAGLPAGAEVAGELKMPSYAESGLKVELPGGGIDLEDAEEVLLVDFDVSESFGHEAGTSGKWVMHPVLRASDFDLTGEVQVSVGLAAGVTLPQIDSAQITLGDLEAMLTSAGGGDSIGVALTDDDGDGVFGVTFRYVVPGDYELDLAGPAGLVLQTSPALPLQVVVPERETVTVDVEVTGASIGS